MTDRITKALDVLTKQKNTVYNTLHACKVLKDWGNMTLDLKPENSDLLPGMERIPLRVGIPGLSLKLKPGGSVWLGFENAEPDRPVAYLLEAGTLELLEFTTGQGQRLKINDDRGLTSDESQYTAPQIQLIDHAGQEISMGGNKGFEFIDIRAKSGASISIDFVGNIQINTPDLSKLVYNGREVARIGDRVVGQIVVPLEP